MRLLMCVPLFALLVSCYGTSKYMVEDKTPDSHVPPPGKAMVIFVRPSSFGAFYVYSVLDDKGEYLGQVPACGHVKHVASPGRHRYILWSAETNVMDADLEAGKTYYVKIQALGGPFYPVKRGSGYWDTVVDWVDDSYEWDVDEALAKKWRVERPKGIPKQLERAKKKWAALSDGQKAAYTFAPSDGR